MSITKAPELLATHLSQLLGGEITHVTNRATPRYLATYYHELPCHLMLTTPSGCTWILDYTLHRMPGCSPTHLHEGAARLEAWTPDAGPLLAAYGYRRSIFAAPTAWQKVGEKVLPVEPAVGGTERHKP